MPVGSGRRIWCSNRPACSPTASATAAWAVGGLRDPPVHVAAALGGHDPDGGVHELPAEHVELGAVVGVDDELDAPRVVAARAPARRRSGVPPSRATSPAKPCAAAVHEIEPLVVRQRLLTVDARGGGEQGRDLGDVTGRHGPLDVQRRHGGEATHGPRRAITCAAMARPRTPEGTGQGGRAPAGRRVPGDGHGAVRPRPPRRLRAADRHDPVGPDHRRPGQHGHAGAVRPLPDARRPGRRRSPTRSRSSSARRASTRTRPAA